MDETVKAVMLENIKFYTENLADIKTCFRKSNKRLEETKDIIYEQFFKVDSQPYQIVNIDEKYQEIENEIIRKVNERLELISDQANEIKSMQKQMKDQIIDMMNDNSNISRYTFIIKPPTQKKEVICKSCQSNIEERSYLVSDTKLFFHISAVCLSRDNEISQKVCHLNKLISKEEVDRILDCGFDLKNIIGIPKVETSKTGDNNTDISSIEKSVELKNNIKELKVAVEKPSQQPSKLKTSPVAKKTNRNEKFSDIFQYHVLNPEKRLFCFTCRKQIIDNYLWNSKLHKMFHINKSCLMENNKPFSQAQINRARCNISNHIETYEELSVLIDAGFFYRNFIGKIPKPSDNKPVAKKNENFQPQWVAKMPPPLNKKQVRNKQIPSNKPNTNEFKKEYTRNASNVDNISSTTFPKTSNVEYKKQPTNSIYNRDIPRDHTPSIRKISDNLRTVDHKTQVSSTNPFVNQKVSSDNHFMFGGNVRQLNPNDTRSYGNYKFMNEEYNNKDGYSTTEQYRNVPSGSRFPPRTNSSVPLQSSSSAYGLSDSSSRSELKTKPKSEGCVIN